MAERVAWLVVRRSDGTIAEVYAENEREKAGAHAAVACGESVRVTYQWPQKEVPRGK